MFRRWIDTPARIPGQNTPRNWLRDRHGGLLTWAAMLMVPLLGFIGIGVDSARGYMVRARLSQALDSAALAAGRQASNETKATAAAQLMFKSNFPTGYMDAVVTGPTLAFNTTSDTVAVTASAAIPTYFVHLIGINTFSVSASSEVTRRTVFMDVVVSIDVSGSMDDYIGGTKKITAARNAARTLVDVLFGSSETKELLKMGLVTWNANARILPIGYTYQRDQATSKSVTTFRNPYTGNNVSTIWYAKNSPVPLLSRPGSSWTGCVWARYLHDSTDNDADLRIDFPIVNGKNWTAFRPAERNSDDDTMQCSNQGIQRLSNVRGQMVSALDQVKNPSGNTNLVTGLIWGWSLLGTDGPFAGDATPPPAPGEGELVRALVIMTDGANTQSDTDAYEGKLSASKLNDRTKLAAKAIKDAGIIIYAIQFGYNDSTQSALMKAVASGPSAPYYQYAPDSASLTAAFQEIGNHLSKLRLSK